LKVRLGVEGDERSVTEGRAASHSEDGVLCGAWCRQFGVGAFHSVDVEGLDSPHVLVEIHKGEEEPVLVARRGQSLELSAERGSRTRIDGKCAFAVSHLATGQSQRAVGIDQKIGTRPVVLVGQQKNFCRCWGRWGAEQSGQ